MKMKKFIVPIVCMGLIIGVDLNYKKITKLATDFFTDKKDLIILSGNEYTKNDDYLYVQRSTKYVPLGYQDVLNIFFLLSSYRRDKHESYCRAEYQHLQH